MEDTELNLYLEAVRIAAGKASLGAAETEQATQWIKLALLMIRNRFGTLDSLDPEALEQVVAQAVSSRLSAPGEGITSTEVAVDDARSVKRYETTRGGLYISDDMWALLTPTRKRRGAFSIGLAYTPDSAVRRAW